MIEHKPGSCGFIAQMKTARIMAIPAKTSRGFFSVGLCFSDDEAPSSFSDDGACLMSGGLRLGAASRFGVGPGDGNFRGLRGFRRGGLRLAFGRRLRRRGDDVHCRAGAHFGAGDRDGRGRVAGLFRAERPLFAVSRP